MGITLPASYQNSTYNISITAENAANTIDYEAISSACDNVVKVAKENCDAISKKVRNVKCGKEALSVEDKSMQPLIDEVADFIDTIPDAIEQALEEIKSTSLSKYNEIQGQNNDAALEKFNSEVANAKAQTQ